MKPIPLTIKYAPKSLDEFVGNEKARAQIKAWFARAIAKKEKPLLIWGPPGVGKTSTAYALAREHNLDVIEMNASELRDKQHVERKIGLAGEGLGLFGKGKLILIDDVDAFQREDRGGLAEIINIFKRCKWPIIITATDYWDKKLTPLRNHVFPVEYKRISPYSVLKLLKRIATSEHINISDETLKEIAKKCGGDVRAAINDLYAKMPGFREREEDIFEKMRIIFKSTTYKQAKLASWIIDHDYLKLWIEENIPNEYTKAHDCALAFNFLSRADVFDGRIKRRQYWGFLRYSSDLMTAGVALAKEERYFKFTRYSFPSYLRLMATSQARRKMRKEIGIKLGHILKCGWREGLSFLPTLRAILEKEPTAYIFFDLSEEEAAFVLQKELKSFKAMLKNKQ